MKIKEVKIVNIHKVESKTYYLNGNVNYFVGPNGAGKSTVLEAIQLALLGYIPGYSKTAEAIMKHACGNVMAVELRTDADVVITRTWTRTGTSVRSDVNLTGWTGEVHELLGNIELPVFDFNEFKSMTANKLKEWFIAFFPNEDSTLDLKEYLRKDAQSRALPFEDDLENVSAWLSGREEKGVALIKALNTYLKEEQSYTKGKVAQLQGTINSLVKYDDAEAVDEQEVEQAIKTQRLLESQLVAYDSQKVMYDMYMAKIRESEKALPFKTVEEDTRIAELTKKAADARNQARILRIDASDIQQALNELAARKMSLSNVGATPTCPLTKERCETAAALAVNYQNEVKAIDEQIQFKREEAIECSPMKIDTLEREATNYEAQARNITAEYRKLDDMRRALNDPGDRPSTLSVEDVRHEIARWQDALIKIKANKRYEELTKTVTNDKFKCENYLEILKSWIKLTDANGLQSEIMDKPFRDMESEMTQYLSTMFNKPTQAKFNLVSKANSFSFGLMHDNNYIEFDYLSSGERCLFTLAMIMCILSKANVPLPVIIIDDLLDHLDEANADYLFEAVSKVPDIQFILAGVKECKDSKLCVAV